MEHRTGANLPGRYPAFCRGVDAVTGDVRHGGAERASNRPDRTAAAADVQARTRLDAGTADALRACAASLHASLPQLVCAVWVAVLARLSRQSDVVIGLDITPAQPRETAHAVPLLVTVAAGQSLAELVTRVRRGTNEAMRRRHFPYVDVRYPLGLRPADREPLALSFAFNASDAPRAAGDLRLTVVERDGDAVLLRLDATAGRFTTEEIDTLLDRLAVALAGVAASERPAATAVSELQLMRDDERRLVTDVFSAGAPALAATTLAALFAAATARAPQTLALIAGNEELTYAALDAESNRLARELLARGLGPGDVAALMLPRTSRLIAAVLACVKTGIVYCPLDPTHPRERLEHMISADGAKLLLREAPGPANLGGTLPALMLDDARVRAAIAARSAEPLAERECRAPAPGDAAYIIFTSGSTGLPKGVVVSNGAIALEVRTVADAIALAPGACTLGLFTIGFDVATQDVFMTLSRGATHVLLDESESRDPDLIVQAAVRRRAAVVNATPTLWRTLNVDQLPAGITAMCGGEQLPPDLLRRLARFPAVVNLYGPTEAAVCTALQHVTPDDVRDGIVPVGRPLPGYRVWILDPEGRPVPAGAPGELCIGGAGLADGYAGDPVLTAKRFVACPFADGLMYRTGDLARWRRDGTLDILERIDAQVKIHGHRIELGEIEEVIRGLPWTADVAVVPGGSGSSAHLIAYAVALPGHAVPTAKALRASLAARLPEVMQPSACVALTALPRTPNGKLDRANLPLPPEESSHASTPPQSAEEALLRLGFARVTGRAEIAGDDDFFEIGGDSLRAMILVSEIRQAGFALPMELLFTARTPAAIAASWRRAAAGLALAGTQPLVFVLPGAGGDHPGLAKLRAKCSASLTLVPLDYPDWGGLTRLDATFEAIEAALIAEIERLAPRRPFVIAGYSFGAYLGWAIAETLAAKGRPVAGLVLLDADGNDRDETVAPRGGVLGRAVNFVRVMTAARRRGELSQTLAENISWHLTHGRGLALLRALIPLRGLPLLPRAFRTQLRFFVARELHSSLAMRWYPRFCARRGTTSRYPVAVMRAAEQARPVAGDLGWSRYFLDLRVCDVRGNHLTMLELSGPGSLGDALPRAIAALVASGAVDAQ